MLYYIIFYLIHACYTSLFRIYECTYVHKHTLHYITLHYAVLHYITLHYITLHCIALHCIALHYTTLCYITLHYITLHYITLHCIALHCTALHYTALHYTALHYTALHCIALHCIALHYTTSHYVRLHCITYVHACISPKIHTYIHAYHTLHTFPIIRGSFINPKEHIVELFHQETQARTPKLQKQPYTAVFIPRPPPQQKTNGLLIQGNLVGDAFLFATRHQSWKVQGLK